MPFPSTLTEPHLWPPTPSSEPKHSLDVTQNRARKGKANCAHGPTPKSEHRTCTRRTPIALSALAGRKKANNTRRRKAPLWTAERDACFYGSQGSGERRTRRSMENKPERINTLSTLLWLGQAGREQRDDGEKKVVYFKKRTSGRDPLLRRRRDETCACCQRRGSRSSTATALLLSARLSSRPLGHVREANGEQKHRRTVRLLLKMLFRSQTEGEWNGSLKFDPNVIENCIGPSKLGKGDGMQNRAEVGPCPQEPGDSARSV